MKQIYTLVFIFLLCCSKSFSIGGNGYIVTLDAKIIIGQIDEVYYSDWYSEVTFINTMGTQYQFRPWRISGFAFKVKDEVVRFESKYKNGKWLFLKVIIKGKGLSLYGSADYKIRMSRNLYGYEESKFSAREVWLELKGAGIFRIYKRNFKKKLRSKLSKYPQIVEKIGTPGYGFRDLKKIVAEYNELYEKRITRT